MTGALIHTPDQRLRVFVSSTLAELAEERAAVRAAIERLQLAPVMFELGARPHPPRELYRSYLEQSQVFVGIYWERYGWVAPGEAVSGLEDEYLLSEGMPRLLYVKGPAPDREARLDQLLARVRDDDTASYKPFRTADELAQLVASDLGLLLSEGFVRGSSPTGVVTFLATDIAGGVEPRHVPSDRTGSPRHREIARRAMTSNGGHTFDAVGTGSCGAFANPLDAVRAAIEVQRAVAASSAEGGAEAMAPAGVALHSGVAERHDGAYVGPPLQGVTRLLAAAHGGQVLLSAAVVDLLGDVLPAPLQLRSLGAHRLTDLGPAEEVHQLVAPGLPAEFPPLPTSEVRRHNLPAELSSFVGRERELYDVKRALGDPHGRRRVRQVTARAPGRRRSGGRLSRRRRAGRARGTPRARADSRSGRRRPRHRLGPSAAAHRYAHPRAGVQASPRRRRQLRAPPGRLCRSGGDPAPGGARPARPRHESGGARRDR